MKINEEIEEHQQFNLHSYFSEMRDNIESIIDSTEEIAQKSSKLSSVLNLATIPYTNKNSSNEFLGVLEGFRKKSKMRKFIEILFKVKLKNKSMLNVLKNSFLVELNILSHVKKENSSLDIIKYIIANFLYTLTKKEILKLSHFLNLKTQENPNYIDDLIVLVEKSKNIYIIYICGLALTIQNKSMKENIKRKFSKIFVDFLTNKILNDDQRDKNIANERIMAKFLGYVTPEFFYDNVISSCEGLLIRSSQNAVFIYVLFSEIDNIEYSKEFAENVFETFKDFFFPQNDNNKYCYDTFSFLAKRSDRKILFNKLIEMTFSPDKDNLYKYVINYIIDIFDIKNAKGINNLFSYSEILKGLSYILDNFQSGFDKKFKAVYEKLFEKLIDALIAIGPQEENFDYDKELVSNIASSLSELIDNNNYSNYHTYIYLIGAILIEKFKLNLKDNTSLKNTIETSLKNLMREIDANSVMNLVPLSALALLSGIHLGDNLSNISKSKFFEENLNTLSKTEAISLYITFTFIILNKDNYDDYISDFMEIITCLLFRQNKSISEKLSFEKMINKVVEEQELSNMLLVPVFKFILTLNSEASINSISFRKVAYFLSKFIEKYIDSVTDKTFIKLLLLIHIPNMYLDCNINNKRPHHSNIYINTIYTKLQDKLIPKIESSIELISNFIFSDLGLLNKINIAIVNSCYSIINKVFEKTKVSEVLLKNSFGKLDKNKFKYVNELSKFYIKQVEYIKFYDLEEIIKNLKENEMNYIQTYLINKNEDKEEITQPQQMQKTGKNQKSKKDKDKDKDKKGKQKEETKESTKNKEERHIEYKQYLVDFCNRISFNLIYIIKRLSPIVFLLLNEKYFKAKENIKFTFNKLWELLQKGIFSQTIQKIIYDYFKACSLTQNFALEFSELMYLERNKNDQDLFNNIIEKNISLISKFNSKLQKLLSNYESQSEYIDKFFNFYDFIIIRILFYIVPNQNIGIEVTEHSVETLILILKYSKSLDYNDISYLLVSLLKSNYNGNNLITLLELYFKNASEENFINLTNGILEYEYISKFSFLKAIYDLDKSEIRKYQFLHYKIFILCFSENEQLSELGIKIWNKYNMNIDANFIKTKDFQLGMTDHKERDTINKAVCAYVHLLPKMLLPVLEIYKKFYEEEVVEAKEKEDDEEFEDYIQKRTVLLDYVNENIEFLNSNDKKALLDFLMNVSDKEFREEIFEMIHNTIFKIINFIPEKEIIENILLSIEQQINNINQRNNDDINYKNLSIILMMCNSILIRTFGENKFNQKKEKLFDSLLLMAGKIKNNSIYFLLFKNFQYISKDIQNKTLGVFCEIIEKIRAIKGQPINFGDIYALSGMIKCFGISSFKEKKIDEIIIKNMEKTSSIEDKKNAMFIIKIFFETLKKLFEPFFVEIFSDICKLLGDKENQVRETTHECLKGMMKELSGYGVNQIMPNLIRDLHKMNWKNKVANIEILGQFAFCAPQQLTIFIPKVIKEIMKVLQDPHTKVQETAINVLKDISSAIKNPEIVEISDELIEAISNPFENSEKALNGLLEIEFKHYLDPPSLALIIPIIDYNLKSQSNLLKRISSHILGSIQMIIADSIDLIQYSDIIIPNLKNALFDSNPECRNTIAKAIGSLTKSLGPAYLKDMLNYITGYLENEAETVPRSGAAQAYAEILVSFGESYIDKHLLHLINKIQEGDSTVKEGYLSIFVFLPGCLGDKFEKYFELIFPLIIEAFSDEKANVRNVSNKIFEICIKLYARKNTKELLEPLLIRLFDPNWRIRNSSIALIKTLIMNLNNEFFRESSEYFTKELRDQILTMTFVLKSDLCGNTYTIANSIWRDYVDNIPKYLSKIIKNIYIQIMELLSFQKEETFDIAEASVKLLSSKFNDKFFLELLPILKETVIKEKDNQSVVDSSFFILYTAITEISEKLLSIYKDKILKIVNENLFTPFSSVRMRIAKIAYEMSKKLSEHNLNRNLIFNVMKQARGKPYEEQKKILEIVACIVQLSKGEVINYAIGEIFRKPYEEGFLELGTMVSEDIAIYYSDDIEIQNLYSNLFEAFFKFPVRAVNTIVSISEKLEEESLPLFLEFLDKLQSKIEGKKKDESKKGKNAIEYHFSEIISEFCSMSQQNLIEIMGELVEKNAMMLYFDNKDVTENVGSILKMLVEKTEKSPDIDIVIKSLLKSFKALKQKFEIGKTEEETTEILTNKFTLIINNLLFTYQNGLLYGDEKMLSCDLMNLIITYSSRKNLKPYIMKMVGPMIRILSEKISPLIKEKLMDNAKYLILKSKEDIKGISPQLQSVFLKTLTDSSVQSCEKFQIKAGENIIRLLQFYLRPDVTANDLLRSIQNKIDLQLGIGAIFEMDILSDVIRFYGHVLKSTTTITPQFNTVKIWIKEHQEIPFDILISLLSSYTQFVPKEVLEPIQFSSDLHQKLYEFLSIFNGDIDKAKEKKKEIVSMIQPLKKEQAIILLKPLGKIISKYRCYKELNEKKINELLDTYEEIIQEIIINTDLINPSSEIPDANICVLLLSLGYMKIYDTNKELLKKVFHFIIELMDLGKINLQLLVSCLSLLVLKAIKNAPERKEILEEVGNITEDEKEIQIVDAFLKKIYYLYDK